MRELVLPFTCEQGKLAGKIFLLIISPIIFILAITADYNRINMLTQSWIYALSFLFLFATWGVQIASWIDDGKIRCRCKE